MEKGQLFTHWIKMCKFFQKEYPLPYKDVFRPLKPDTIYL
jgi:hypothetical protein